MIQRIKLPFDVKRPILACGADLKGAFAFAKGKKAFLAGGFGDLGDLDNFMRYEKAVKKLRRKLGIKPQIIACDLHPGYFSSKFAESFQQDCSRAHLSVPYKCMLRRIQHHEAHIASAIIDNNIKGDCIGVAFDGTGYGSDRNIWGGEFFIGGLKGFKRAAHLEYVPMPGGEMAIKEPWRMAASYLYHAFGNKLPASLKRWREKDMAILKTMIERKINSPLTSSAGRLFDGVGSLLLSKDHISKEAELPVELERLASGHSCGKYKFDIRTSERDCIIGISAIIKEIVKDVSKKINKSEISCKFHNTISDAILKTSLILSKKFKLKQVVLRGGVFQNRYLTARTVEALRTRGLEVYTHSHIPANDSGIPIGQIAIANAQHQSGAGQARATCA